MPVEVFELATHEPEVAHAALSEVYTPDRPIRFTGDAADFSCQLRSLTAGQVAADELSISMGMHTTMAPPDYFMVAAHLRGRCRYTAGRQEVPVLPGGVYLFSTTDHLLSRYEALRLATVRLPWAVLERVATERFDVGPDHTDGPSHRDDSDGAFGSTGDAAGGLQRSSSGRRPARGSGKGFELRFDGHTPLDGGLRRGWLHLSAFAQSQLAPTGAAGSSSLVAASLADLVASTALVTFPNTTMGASAVRGPGWVASAVVRRAVAHIEAHADQPLTVSEIARVVGVGPRALQLAFARHLGVSPTGYLRRVRLERARRELQAGDATAGDTVAGVARRWGWASASRFSAAYRQVYGVAPSRTLRT